MSPPEPDDDFMVFWPNGGSNVLTSTDLTELPIDLAGRLAFAAMVCGWRPYASMTNHASADLRSVLKVVPLAKYTAGMTYASLP